MEEAQKGLEKALRFCGFILQAIQTDRDASFRWKWRRIAIKVGDVANLLFASLPIAQCLSVRLST